MQHTDFNRRKKQQQYFNKILLTDVTACPKPEEDKVLAQIHSHGILMQTTLVRRSAIMYVMFVQDYL